MRTVLVLLLLALYLPISGCMKEGNGSGNTELPTIRKAPEFSSSNYDGRIITNSDLDGNVFIVDFFFTSCGGPCPIMSSTANVLQSEFSEYEDFRIVSFTVDPDTDTLERLTKYADRYGAKKNRWYLLRNKKEVVAELSHSGFLMGDPDNPVMHSTRFALVDREGQIRGYFDGTDPEKVDDMRAALEQLLGEEAV